MKLRTKKYLEKKEYKRWEQSQMECFYCVPCQAMNEWECVCDFLEEQEELKEQMFPTYYSDFND